MLPTNPETRLETYLARLAGQDVSIPDTPITRVECYLDYIIRNGGGVPAPNAGAHNSLFRGKDLGTSFTSAQSAAITAGTFDDLFVGDYWTIGDVVYRIAGLDIFLGIGDTPMTVHHAVIVTDASLYNAKMNAENTVTGGYGGSALKTSGLADALATVTEAFGSSHILTFRTYVTTDGGAAGPTNAAWADTQIDVMTESQVLGRGSWGTQSQNGFNVNDKYSIFPLFSHAPHLVTNRVSYWLQDIRNVSTFACIDGDGKSARGGASASMGVRPYFLIA